MAEPAQPQSVGPLDLRPVSLPATAHVNAVAGVNRPALNNPSLSLLHNAAPAKLYDLLRDRRGLHTRYYWGIVVYIPSLVLDGVAPGLGCYDARWTPSLKQYIIMHYYNKRKQ